MKLPTETSHKSLVCPIDSRIKLNSQGHNNALISENSFLCTAALHVTGPSWNFPYRLPMSQEWTLSIAGSKDQDEGHNACIADWKKMVSGASLLSSLNYNNETWQKTSNE